MKTIILPISALPAGMRYTTINRQIYIKYIIGVWIPILLV